MIELPQRLTDEELRTAATRPGAHLVISSRVRQRLIDWVGQELDDGVPLAGASEVVVVGGGGLIDSVKLAARAAGVDRVTAVPTIWGSGAEASPVAVAWTDGCTPVLDDSLRPTARGYVTDLVGTPGEMLTSSACADAWSHAIEGLLSPLATDSLRADLADVIRDATALPVAVDDRWFEVSATACAGQARSSVGVAHGMAHVVEAARRATDGNDGWHHARYIRAFLLPAVMFDLESSPKAAQRFEECGLDADAIVRSIGALFDPADYAELLPTLGEQWKSVVRDLCTRTNVALVRPAAVSFFEGFTP